MPSDLTNWMSTYSQYDSTVSSDISNQIYVRVGLNADSTLSTTEHDLKKIVDAQSIPGHSFDDLVKIQSLFNDRIADYIQQTQELIVTNDLVNMNKYVKENMNSELHRTVQLKDKTVNGVHKVRQSYMMKKYAIGYWNFWAYTIQFSLFLLMACALLVLMAFDPKLQLNKWAASIVAFVIFVFWLVIFVLLVKQTSMRRRDDWNKFYFPTKETEAAGSCSAK